MGDSKMMRGTLVLTAATLLSKILGFIYIIPFAALVGQSGIALYGFGYTQYTVLLSLSTLGVPLAVSKFVSKYHSLGDYETGHRLFKSGIWVMLGTGLLSFLLLFLAAPVIAPYILKNPIDNSLEDLVFTIRMVSFALIVVPVMALIRGYFQGFQSMGPTSVSQVLEQLVRIIFILTMAFAIVQFGNGEIGTAVGFATFGAFVGALGGLAVLIYYWSKRKKYIHKQIAESTVSHQLSLKDMYKELISYALPLSFVGLAIPLFQLVDTYTVNSVLGATQYRDLSETFFGILNQSVHKIVLIPTALATALSITLVPTITKSFVSGDTDKLQRQITQTYQMILFISIPAVVGLSFLAEPIFAALFGMADLEIGSEVLRYYGPIALFFSLFSATAAVLQGMNRQKYAVIALLAGLALKVICNPILLYFVGPTGAIAATYIGFIAGVALNIWAIGHFANFSYRAIVKRGILITIFSSIMAIAVSIANTGMQLYYPMVTRTNSFLVMGVSIAVGAVVFIYLSYRSHLTELIFGPRFGVPRRPRARG